MNKGPAGIRGGDGHHAREGRVGPVEGWGCSVLHKPSFPPRAPLTESRITHREGPWPRSPLQMGTLVSAVRQCSAPGTTANRHRFAETTANCS